MILSLVQPVHCAGPGGARGQGGEGLHGRLPQDPLAAGGLHVIGGSRQ